MEFIETSPQAWLQSEFRRRKQKNPSFSLRRMAQQLDLPSGRLSEILNGHRRVTKTLGLKISEKLAYPPAKKKRFLDLIDQHCPKGKEDLEAISDSQFLQLSTDSFYVLADWYHFAILSLIELDDFEPAPQAIGARLGISSTEVRSALDRLERLGLIERKEDRILKTMKNVTTTHDIESAALKMAHKQDLKLVEETIDSVPVALRDITSMTMAIDLEKLPQAKAMIKKFRRQLSLFLESGAKNQVYNLNVQLIPLTKMKGRR